MLRPWLYLYVCGNELLQCLVAGRGAEREQDSFCFFEAHVSKVSLAAEGLHLLWSSFATATQARLLFEELEAAECKRLTMCSSIFS